MSRLATTLAALQRYPVFYHDKAITIVGTAVEADGGTLAALAMDAPKQFIIVPRSGRVRAAARTWGRLFTSAGSPDDSRLGPLDSPRVIKAVAGDRWPARGQLLVLHGASWSDRDAQPAATMRNLALCPIASRDRP